MKKEVVVVKKKKIIIAVIIVVLLITACFAYIKINYPYALYFGDRITGTYSSHVNGTYYGIDAHEISCVYDGENVRVDTDSEKSNFGIKGNEYGRYDICFTTRKGDIHKLLNGEVELDDDFKICVSLVKNKNQFDHVNVHTEFFCENGEWYVTVTADRGAYRLEKTQKLDNSNFEIKIDFGV